MGAHLGGSSGDLVNILIWSSGHLAIWLNDIGAQGELQVGVGDVQIS